MKAKEAQLLGVLALVATGIVFAGLWAGGENSGSPVNKKNETAQKNESESSTTLADNQESRASAEGREEWLKNSSDSGTDTGDSAPGALSEGSGGNYATNESQTSTGPAVATNTGSRGDMLEELASNGGTSSDTTSESGNETATDAPGVTTESDPDGQSDNSSGKQQEEEKNSGDAQKNTQDSDKDGGGASGQLEVGGTKPESSGIDVEAEEESETEEQIEEQDREISSRLEGRDPEDVPVVEEESLGSGEGAETQTTTHKVQEGETLASISRQYYDTPGNWKSIMKANAMMLDSPQDLQPGMELTIPDASDGSSSATEQGLPEPSGPGLQEGPEGHTVYKVKKEDTLYSIAKEFYGDGSVWRKILEENSDVLDGPQDLRKGMKLILP